MKKRLLTAVMALALCASLVACGNKTAEQPVEVVDETTDATVVTPEVAPEEVVQDDAAIDMEANNEENVDPGFSVDAEAGDFQAFATSVKDTIKMKNIEALAGLVTYPVYVAQAGKAEDGTVVETQDNFMEIKPDTIFTKELVEAMEAIDVTTLTKVEAGYVMMNGEEGPSITFNEVEGVFGITGIQY